MPAGAQPVLLEGQEQGARPHEFCACVSGRLPCRSRAPPFTIPNATEASSFVEADQSFVFILIDAFKT